MKLHLPKQLFTALLAAITSYTLATGAAYGALTTTNYDASGNVIPADDTTTEVAETVDQYDGASNERIDIRRDVDKIIFNMDANGNSNWFQLDNKSPLFEGEVQIGADGEDAKGLVITAASNNVQPTFSGKVTGSGKIYYTSTEGANVKFTFSGDVTEYEGNMELDTRGGDFTLAFGNGGAVATTVTSTAGVAGTGDISFLTDKNTLTFNYNTDTPAYVTNAISAGEGGVSKVTVTNGNMVFTKENQIDILTLTAGSATFNSNVTLGSVSGAGSLSFGANTKVSLGSAIGSSGTVSFAEGATIDYVGDISNLVTTYAHDGYGTAATLDLLASTTADREVTVSVYGQGSYTMNTDGTVSGVTDTTGNYYIAGNVSSSTILNSGDDLTTMSKLVVKSGTLTVDSAWTVPALQGTAGTIQLTNNLTISGDSTLTRTILQGEGELIIGADATLTVNSTATNIRSNIRVGSGATLEFLGTGADAIDYGRTDRTIYVNGGKIDVGTTRQTVGNWTFDLTGATIQGAGQSSVDYIGLDFHRSSTINVHGAAGATTANPTISTIDTKVRIQSGHTLTYGVDANARLNQSGALVINGTITKDGAGTLYLSSSNTGSGAINVEEGTLATNKLTALGTGTTTVKNGAYLDLTDCDSQVTINSDNRSDDFSAINDAANIVTEEGGYIRVAFNHSGSAELKLIESLSLKKNIEAQGALVIHGSAQSRSITIGEGITLIAKGSSNNLEGLEAINTGIINISGGSVEASRIVLGHDTAGTYWGKLAMSAGELTTGTIYLRQNHSNIIDITGGSLEFTTAGALNRQYPNKAINTATTITIGGTAEAPVTLKATQVAWTLDGTGLTTVPTIGNVTIDGDNTYGITLQNVKLTGTITNDEDLTLGAASVATAATVAGDGTTELTGDLTGSGTLTKSGSGILEMGAITTSASVSIEAGGVVFNGTLTLGESAVFTAGAEATYTLGETFGMGDAPTSYVDLNDTETADGSGFAKYTSTVISGGTLSNAFTVTDVTGTEYAVTNDQRDITFVTQDYYLKSGSVSGAAVLAKVDSATIHLAADTTLDVDTTVGDVVLSGNATASFTDKGRLNADSLTLDSNTLTLTGNGVYALASGSVTLTSGVTLGEGWTGAVLVSDYGVGQTLSLKSATDDATTLGNKVGLSNVVAWLGADTITKALVLFNSADGTAALTLNNGSSNATGTFQGAISGDGDIRFTWNAGTNNNTSTHDFTGDTSNWDGWFISGSENTNKWVAVSFTSSGSVFSAEGNGGVKDDHDAPGSSKLEVVVGNSSADVTTDITFNGSIVNAKKLDVYDKVTFKNGVAATTVNVKSGASMTLQGALTSTTVSLADSTAALIFDNSSEVTANGSMTGAGSVEKKGAGILNLGSGSGNLTGNITVTAGTLKAGSGQSTAYFGADYGSNKNRTITVKKGAALDVNGTEAYYHVVLEDGATLKNSSSTDISAGWKALPYLELTGDATVEATSQIAMHQGDGDKNSGGTYKLELGGHTLTKTGADSMYLHGSISIGAGTIKIDNGTFQMDSGVTLESGVNLTLNGGSLNSSAEADFAALTVSSTTGTFEISKAMRVTGGTTLSGGTLTKAGTGVLTLNGGITGSGSIVGAGSTVIGAGNELSGTTISITDVEVGGTLINAAELTLNGVVNITSQEFLTATGMGSYGSDDSGNGFYNGSYYVIQTKENTEAKLTLGDTFELQLIGTALPNSSADGGAYWSKDAAGNLLITTMGTSGTYYVNKNTVTVGGSSATTGVEAASAFHVASGAKLDIAELPTGWTAAELLAGKVAGAGTLLVSQSDLVTGEITTTFRGTLELAGGVTLTLGETVASAANEAKVVNTTSLNKVILNEGSRLQYQGNGSGTEFKDLTVNGSGNLGATIYIIDGSSGEANAVKLTGNTQLNHTLNLTSQYGARYTISNLSGTGTLNAQGTGNESFFTTIQGLNGFQGTINFTDTNNHTVVVSTGTEAELVSFDSLQFTAGEGITNTFNVQTNTSVGTVNMAGGTVNLAAGTTLTLGQTGEGAQATSSSLGTVVASSGGNTIHLNETATLNKITKGGGSGAITLTGSGVYDLGEVSELGFGNNTIGNVVGVTTDSLKDTENWTGTVRLHGTTKGALLNNLSNSNSWVEVGSAGLSGYLNQSGDSELCPNIRLTGDMELTENSGLSSYKFTGDYAGAGAFKVSYANGTERSFEFAGNIAEWTGAFTQTATATGTTSNVKFIGEAKDINTEISNAAGTLNLEINTTDNATLSKNVSVSKVQVNNTVTLTGESNSITAGNVTISQKNASLSNVTVQSGSIAATSTADGAKGSISGALVEMQSATSFSISDMVLSNVKLSAVEGASVALTNVSATNTLLAGGGDFTLNATPTVEAAVNDTANGRISYTCGLGVESGSSLTLNLDVINAVRPDQHGTYDLSITLSGFGSDFAITSEEAILGMVKFDASSWLAQALEEQGAEWRAEITEATENTVVTQSSVPTVTYSAGTGENVGSLVITINGLNVPEPATSTLSLLALAALAARRRRK